MDKTILLASFIFPERVDWFLSYLEAKFDISKDKVFCYQNLEDDSKRILTFKFFISKDRRVNLKDLFPSAIPIHKKGAAIYTINALNKLIDQELNGSIGNIDHKSFKINWDVYQNKMILLNGKDLKISPIARLF